MDVHVRAMPSRLSTAELEVTQPLSILPPQLINVATTAAIMATKTTQMTATKITLAAMVGGEVKRRAVVIQVLLQ